MKTLLVILSLLCLGGCAAINGNHIINGTTVGISAGMPDGLTLVIGYKHFEMATCENGQTLSSNIEGTVTSTGIDGKQSFSFGH